MKSVILLILMFANPAFAELNPSDSFQSGIRLLQEKKYPEARDIFQTEYANGREFAALFYNWGLAEYYLDRKGLAAGLWRKALSIDADTSVAREALAFIKKELPSQATEEYISLLAQIELFVSETFSLNKMFITVWLLFLFSGFLIIRYLGARKKSIRDNLPLPKLPALGFSFSFLFVLFLLATGLKISTLYESRGTIIQSSVPLRTSPNENGNIIFDVFEGLDVKVKSVQDSWALVSLRSGLSGWLPTNAIFQHSGEKKLW